MFSDVFIELLMENGLNQSQFAAQAGIPYPTVIGWTKKNRLPDFSALNKIADFFDCSVDRLMGRQEQEAKPPDSEHALPSLREKGLLKNFRRLDADDRELIFILTERLNGDAG